MRWKLFTLSLLVVLLCSAGATAVPQGENVDCSTDNPENIEPTTYVIYCAEYDSDAKADEQPNRISNAVYENEEFRERVIDQTPERDYSGVTTAPMLYIYSGDWEPETQRGIRERRQKLALYLNRNDTREGTGLELLHKISDETFNAPPSVYSATVDVGGETLSSEFRERSNNSVSLYPWMYGPPGSETNVYRETLSNSESYETESSEVRPIEDAYIEPLRITPHTNVGYRGGEKSGSALQRKQIEPSGKIRVAIDYRADDIPSGETRCGGFLSGCSPGDTKIEYEDDGSLVKNGSLTYKINDGERTVVEDVPLSSGINEIDYSLSDGTSGNVTFNFSAEIENNYEKEYYEWQQVGTEIVSCSVNFSSDCTGELTVDCSEEGTDIPPCQGINETVTVDCQSGPGCEDGTKEEPVYDWVLSEQEQLSKSMTVTDEISGFVSPIYTDRDKQPTLETHQEDTGQTKFTIKLPETGYSREEMPRQMVWSTVRLYQTEIGETSIYMDRQNEKSNTIVLDDSVKTRSTAKIWLHGEVRDKRLVVRINNNVVYSRTVSTGEMVAGQREFLGETGIGRYLRGKDEVDVEVEILNKNGTDTDAPRVWVEIHNQPELKQGKRIDSQWENFFARDKGWDFLRTADEDGDSGINGVGERPFIQSEYYPPYAYAAPIKNVTGNSQIQVLSTEAYSEYSTRGTTEVSDTYSIPSYSNLQECTSSYHYGTSANAEKNALRDCDFNFETNKTAYQPVQEFTVESDFQVDEVRINSISERNRVDAKVVSRTEEEKAAIDISRDVHTHEEPVDSNRRLPFEISNQQYTHDHLNDENKSWFRVTIRTHTFYNDSINMQARDVPGEYLVIQNASIDENGNIGPKRVKTGENGTVTTRIYVPEEKQYHTVNVSYQSGEWEEVDSLILYESQTVTKEIGSGSNSVSNIAVSIATAILLLLIMIKVAAAVLNKSIRFFDPIKPVFKNTPETLWLLILLGGIGLYVSNLSGLL